MHLQTASTRQAAGLFLWRQDDLFPFSVITEHTATVHNAPADLQNSINPFCVYSFPPPFLFKHAGLNVLIASVIFYVQERIWEQCISKDLYA